MKITVEVISPELAAELLATNVKNRPLVKRHLLFLADQMTTGQWQMSGDPIRISDTGELLDGQHRLHAIVASGTTQTMVIMRDLPVETFHVMDTGRIRLARDILAIAGQVNSSLVASVARMIINYNRGVYSNTLANRGRSVGYSVTNGEILAFSKEHDIQRFILQGKVWYTEWRIFTASEYGFFYYILSQIDVNSAFEFLNALALGADLQTTSPIFVLRKKMEQYHLNRVATAPMERYALMIKAWNLFRTDKTIGYLIWKPDKESVPIPI